MKYKFFLILFTFLGLSVGITAEDLISQLPPDVSQKTDAEKAELISAIA